IFHPLELVLPVATLYAGAVAATMRLTRGAVIEVLQSDFVLQARLRGIPEYRVIRRHVVPNSLVATLQMSALATAGLLGGAALVEYLFQYPGLGQAMVNAVNTRDIPVVEAIALIVGGICIVANVAADVGTVLLTPRLRTRG